jgi:molybdate transport system ATP-binding protein
MLKLEVRLRRADFAIEVAFEQGARVTGVFGASGAGKSTLMHVIAGLESADSGRIELDGETLFDSATGVNVPAHRRRVGVMFQDDRLFPHMTVAANISYGHRTRTGSTLRPGTLEKDEVVALLGLSALLPRAIATLSGGERQRVALCRALKSEPRLLLLDEPLSSLDAGIKRQILTYLARVRDATGIPMLYVSHDLTEVLQITDHLLLLERGRAIAHGCFSEIAHQHAALDALRDGGLVNVLQVKVASSDPGGLALLTIEGESALEEIPSLRAAIDAQRSVGETIPVAVRAADVAIALREVHGVSIQNQIPGRITRITPHGSHVIVEVDVGVPLLAELTPRAIESLRLAPGTAVKCLIKSNAVRAAT